MRYNELFYKSIGNLLDQQKRLMDKNISSFILTSNEYNESLIQYANGLMALVSILNEMHVSQIFTTCEEAMKFFQVLVKSDAAEDIKSCASSFVEKPELKTKNDLIFLMEDMIDYLGNIEYKNKLKIVSSALEIKY